jgi:hypothetical protein
MKPEEFKFRGKPASRVILVRIWEEIRLELTGKYAVDNIEMPDIQALVLNYKNFTKAFNKLLLSLHIEDTSEIEWGTKCTSTIPSALIFFADVDQTWIILKCDGYGYSLEVDLRHELLHLWESKLGLKWGTLTKMGKKARNEGGSVL